MKSPFIYQSGTLFSQGTLARLADYVVPAGRSYWYDINDP